MTVFSLYLITDRHQTGGRPLLEVVRQALEGGVRAVQLREKDLSGAELYHIAVALRELTREFGARLLINDRTDIACAVDADGVHVGNSSLPVRAVRRILGVEKTIIYSAHSIDEAMRAQAAGADFVTFGPVYRTASKEIYGDPCGVKKLEEAADLLGIPVIALGGISSANIMEVLSANIHGVAVISAILSAPDPSVAAATLLKKIEEYAQLP